MLNQPTTQHRVNTTRVSATRLTTFQIHDKIVAQQREQAENDEIIRLATPALLAEIAHENLVEAWKAELDLIHSRFYINLTQFGA